MHDWERLWTSNFLETEKITHLMGPFPQKWPEWIEKKGHLRGENQKDIEKNWQRTHFCGAELGLNEPLVIGLWTKRGHIQTIIDNKIIDSKFHAVIGSSFWWSWERGMWFIFEKDMNNYVLHEVEYDKLVILIPPLLFFSLYAYICQVISWFL